MRRACLLAIVACLALTPPAWMAALPRVGAPRPGADPAVQLAARIDLLLDTEMVRHDVAPAPLADDATFLRRATLDLTGRIPTVAEVRAFLADRSPDRRARAVQRLLDAPGYATFQATLWRELLVPNSMAEFNRRYMGVGIERWLIRHFQANTGYDEMVRELLALPFGRTPRQDFFNTIFGNAGPSPIAFYMEKEGKAAETAAGVARVFLGVRLECAQCHDHPFAEWTREQFWQQAAFFASLKATRGDIFSPIVEEPNRREILIPNTTRVAQARFLDGGEPRWRFKTSARATLADWMVARDNPFFAKATVNRVWEHLFGTGLVDPVDDFRGDNPPSHPALLDELARGFADSGYDLKALYRTLMLTRAYQRSSKRTDPVPPARLYARMQVRALQPEALVESLEQATGMRDTSERSRRVFVFNSPRQKLLEKFMTAERRTEAQLSIPQALTLMNNDWVARATSHDRGPILAGILASPFLDEAGKVEAIFLAVLSRKPTPEEGARFGAYVARGGATGDKPRAFSDVMWALLNSTEFSVNH